MKVNNCYKCKHWKGAKDEVKNDIKHNPQCMHLEIGWPLFGECCICSASFYIEIKGDAKVKLEVPANFGCIFFIEDE